MIICRYKGRGLFVHAPYVGIVKGRWRLIGKATGNLGAAGESWGSLEELLQAASSREVAAGSYRGDIEAAIDRWDDVVSKALEKRFRG